VIVGAPIHPSGGLNLGYAALYLGSPAGLATAPVWEALGTEHAAAFGFSVRTAGDVNDDGFADVIVGAPGRDGDRGSAYVYLGAPSGNLTLGAELPGPANGGRFGHSVHTAGDVDSDGFDDVVIGGPGTDSSGMRGHVRVYRGSAGGVELAAHREWQGSQNGAWLGWAVAPAGDLNGDGFADVVTGAPGVDGPGTDLGLVSAFFGGPAGLSSMAGGTLWGDENYRRLGWALETAGDLQGDGFADLIVGGPGTTNPGEQLLYAGSALGLVGPIHSMNISGIGWATAVATAGDIDGDGFSDYLVGAPGFDGDFTDEGFVIVGYWTGAALQGAHDAKLAPVAEKDFGEAVHSAGDLNGDGFDDIVVGSPSEGGTGTVRVYYGSVDFSGELIQPDWQFTPAGTEWFGYSVASVGDMNGDGFDDLVVGAPVYSATLWARGAVYVFAGSETGLSGTPRILEGLSAFASLGWSVAGGDVNGDGCADLIAGAPDTNSSIGEVCVYLGSPAGYGSTPSWTAAGEGDNDYFGWSVAGIGDVDGDGYGDIAIGAPLVDHSPSKPGVGKVYVYLGGPSGLGGLGTTLFPASNWGAQFGFSLAGAGDVDGDGRSDLVVGEPCFSGSHVDGGRVLLYLGKDAGPGWVIADTELGDASTHFLGWSVDSAGDVNGDGFSDIIAGAPGFETTSGGGRPLLIVCAHQPGTGSYMAASSWNAVPADPNLDAGRSVARAGDVNGDGFSDVIVGAPCLSPLSLPGEAYVYLGNHEYGGRTRRPVQSQASGSARLAIGGRTAVTGAFDFGLRAWSPAGREELHFVWEVRRHDESWDVATLEESLPHDPGLPGPDGAAVDFTCPVTGLEWSRSYCWRVRVTSNNPFFPRGPWFSASSRSLHEAKLRSSVSTSGGGSAASSASKSSLGPR